MVLALSDIVAAAIGVGALVAVVLCLWLLAWWLAWDPAWLARWRHAVGEAGWRMSATWAEFTDWVRLGR